MKRAINILLFVLLGTVFVLSSCLNTDNDACYADGYDAIDSIWGPVSGTVGNNIVFKVKTHVENGCGNFEKFDEKVNETVITVAARTFYKGCICSTVVTYFKKDYTFKPTQPGTYTFKFWQYGDKYLESKVVVTN